MKTDKWWVSLLWGRVGAAVLVLCALALQQLGIVFDEGTQREVFDSISQVLAGIGVVFAIISKAREARRKKTDQSGHAAMPTLFVISSGALLSAALVWLIFFGCATGPSQYAADNPDSYLVKAIQAAGMTPEGVQEQISSIVAAEIAMGTFLKEDALTYMDGLEVYLNDGASYADAKALAERYMMRYIAKSDPISHAAVLAYYLFKTQLKIPDLGMPIVEADRKVLQDLFAAVRADLGE